MQNLIDPGVPRTTLSADDLGRENEAQGWSAPRFSTLGEVCMAARQVILYFDDQKDALRFALAAGSVMATNGESVGAEERTLIQETQRANRILLDEAVNTETTANSAT
jgi:hypothetical protein